MPPRTRPPGPRRASAPLLAALLLASCASADSASRGPGGAPIEDRGDRPAIPEKGMKAGWMDLRPATKAGQVSSLTLLSGNTPEGRLIQRGRAQMPGGKVIDDGTASDLLAAFANSGFDRFAVRANPTQGPAAAMAVVWIDRGSGYESLFFLPGARKNPETADLPDVYDGLKKLILGIHQATPGSAVTTGQGWSGDDLLKQKPGDPGR